jgi:hypothetical protein
LIFLIDNIYRGRYPVETGVIPFGEPTQTEAQKEKALRIAQRIFKKYAVNPEKLKINILPLFLLHSWFPY